MEEQSVKNAGEAEILERRKKLAEWYDQYMLVQEMMLDADLMGSLKRGKQWIEGFRSEMVGQLAGDVSGRSVLDIGCQYGLFSFFLLEKGAKVTAVDISERWVQKCTEKAASEYPGRDVKFLVADAQDLPFKNESFDAVVCTEVVEHVDFPGKVISEIYRVLVPDGVLVLGTPNTGSYYVKLYKVLKELLPMGAIRWVLGKVSSGEEKDLYERIRDQLPPDKQEEFDLERKKLTEMGQELGISSPDEAGMDEHIREFSSVELENLLDFEGFDVEKRTGFTFFPTYFFLEPRIKFREQFVPVKDASWWRYHSAPQMYVRASKRKRPIFLD
jgi:2-polyprenyl-3-methyl-5-hydroxy-6-metoxy-1,4-benzoquinol methylase